MASIKCANGGFVPSVIIAYPLREFGTEGRGSIFRVVVYQCPERRFTRMPMPGGPSSSRGGTRSPGQPSRTDRRMACQTTSVAGAIHDVSPCKAAANSSARCSLGIETSRAPSVSTSRRVRSSDLRFSRPEAASRFFYHRLSTGAGFRWGLVIMITSRAIEACHLAGRDVLSVDHFVQGWSSKTGMSPLASPFLNKHYVSAFPKDRLFWKQRRGDGLRRQVGRPSTRRSFFA